MDLTKAIEQAKGKLQLVAKLLSITETEAKLQIKQSDIAQEMMKDYHLAELCGKTKAGDVEAAKEILSTLAKHRGY